MVRLGSDSGGTGDSDSGGGGGDELSTVEERRFDTVVGGNDGEGAGGSTTDDTTDADDSTQSDVTGGSDDGLTDTEQRRQDTVTGQEPDTTGGVDDADSGGPGPDTGGPLSSGQPTGRVITETDRTPDGDQDFGQGGEGGGLDRIGDEVPSTDRYDAETGLPSGTDPSETFSGRELTTGQGLEGQSDTAIGRQASEFEREVLADNPTLRSDDIAIVRVGNDLVVRQTESSYWGGVNSRLDRQDRVSETEFRGVQEYAQRRADARAEAVQEAREQAAAQLEQRISGIRAGNRPGLGQIEDPEEVAERTRRYSDVDPSDINVRFEDGRVVATPSDDLEQEVATLQLQGQFADQGYDFQAGEDFTVEKTEGGRFSAELTESAKEEVREQRRQEDLEDSNIVERYGQFVLGPPGGLEQDVRGFAGSTFEAVAGPPGGIERTIGGLVPEEGHELAGAASDTAGDVGSAVEGAAQPIIGPPGGAEQTLYDVSDTATETLREDVIEPGSEVAGDVADFTRQGFGMLDPRTHLEGDTLEQTQRFVESGVDVVRGEEQELGETGSTEAAGEEVGRAVGSLGTFVTGSPRTFQQVGETALGAGEFAVTENPAESVEAGFNVGQATAEQVAGQVARRPVYTTAQILATGGTMSAARRIGPRASAVTRGVIQPGEELLGKAGAAAFRAAPGGWTTRAGQVLFPRGEPLFASEEAAFMAAGKARSVISRVRQRVGDVDVDTTGRVRGAGPSVSFESDPEAGFLEIDSGLRQQLRERVVDQPAETVRAAPGRARQAGEEAAETVGNVPGQFRNVGQGLAEDVRAAPSRAREAGRSAVETGRQRFTQLELQAEQAGFRAGYRAGQEIDRLLNASPRGFMDSAAARARQGVARGRQEFTELELRAEEAGYQAGERVGSGLSRLEDISLGGGDLVQRAGERAGEAVETGRQRFTQLELQAEEAGFQAGFRTGRAASQASETVRSAPTRLAEAGQGAVETGRQRFTQLELQAEQAGFRAGYRTGSGVDRLLNARLNTEIGQRARREATSLRFGLSERAAGTRQSLSNLRDATIRIGDGERATLFETESGEPAIRSQLDNPLGIETDTETDTEDGFTPEPTESEGVETDTSGGGTRVVSGETGVGQQRVIARPETETEGGGDSEMDTQPVLRSEVRTEPVGAGDTTLGLDTRLGSELGSEVGSRSALDTRQDTESLQRVRLGLSTELDQEAEAEAESELERELELEQEVEQEAEAEGEGEGEFEFRAEFGDEPDGGDGPSDERDSTTAGTPDVAKSGLGSGWYSEYVTALALGPATQGRGAASESTLEEQGNVARYTSTLPTQAQVSGTEEQQEAIEAARSTLTFGAGDGETISNEDDGMGFDLSF